MKKKIMASLLAVVLFIVSVGSTCVANAESTAVESLPDGNISFFGLDDSISADNIVLPLESKTQDYKLSQEMKSLCKAQKTQDSSSPLTQRDASVQNIPLGDEPAGNISFPLNEGEIHMCSFTLHSNKFMYSKLTSSNSGYYYLLVGYNENNETILYGDSSSSNNILNQALPEGDYLILVTSNAATDGKDYTLYLNTSTPIPENAESIGLIQLDPSYQHLIAQITQTDGNKITYFDGAAIYNENDSSILEWQRVMQRTWTNSYNDDTHSIFDPKVKGFSNRGIYESDYVSSDEAIVIFLDVDSGFSYYQSQRNWDTGTHNVSKIDPSGQETPRRLTSTDIDHYHCWLIFDLNTGKPIDFWSDLNWYYYTGTEHASFTEY